MNEAHESEDCLLAVRGYASKALELAEEALNLVTFFVKPPVNSWFLGTAGDGLDVGARPKIIGDQRA